LISLYGAAIGQHARIKLADPQSASPDTDLLVRGNDLLYFRNATFASTREPTPTFILGAVFGVSDTLPVSSWRSPRNFFSQRSHARARPAQLHERQVRTGKPR